MKMASENRSVFPVFVIDDAHLVEKESLMDICSLMFNPLKEAVGASFIFVGDETLFEPDALSIMSSHCRGNRRQIMNMGTLLLAEAFYRQEKTIGAELIYNCDQIEISE